MAQVHTTVTSADGTRLAVRTAGPADAPAVLLLHGWAQSGRVWSDQFADPALTERFRLLAVDLRGHGDSDAPPGDGYRDPATWSADVTAVLDLVDGPAVLVGWSYGGLVALDHLRVAGRDRVAGLVLVGAISEIGRDRVGGTTGPAMRAALPAALAEDVAVAGPALVAFGAAQAAGGALPGERVQQLVGESLRVPPRVRSALFRRDVSNADLLATLDLPTLLVHGDQDAVVDPAAARYTAGLVPGAELRWFEGVGHLPFAERPGEFNAALADFAAGVLATGVRA